MKKQRLKKKYLLVPRVCGKLINFGFINYFIFILLNYCMVFEERQAVTAHWLHSLSNQIFNKNDTIDVVIINVLSVCSPFCRSNTEYFFKNQQVSIRTTLEKDKKSSNHLKLFFLMKTIANGPKQTGALKLNQWNSYLPVSQTSTSKTCWEQRWEDKISM